VIAIRNTIRWCATRTDMVLQYQFIRDFTRNFFRDFSSKKIKEFEDDLKARKS
jgi:hypothetical protein